MRQYGEACEESDECSEELVCDIRVQETPLSYRRTFTCKKTFGDECTNGTECANYLPCVDGVCGCRVINDDFLRSFILYLNLN